MKSFPRTRGVVPLYGVDINGTATIPRVGGVDPLYGVDINGTAGFLAHAGLFRVRNVRRDVLVSFPRSCGVVPILLLPMYTVTHFPPLMRGFLFPQRQSRPRHVPPVLDPPQRRKLPRNRAVRLFYKESTAQRINPPL